MAQYAILVYADDSAHAPRPLPPTWSGTTGAPKNWPRAVRRSRCTP